MSVTDNKLDKAGKASLKCITMELGTSATDAAAVLVDALVPGFNFVVERVEAYAKTVTATISLDVLIGATSVLSAPITPVADTPTAGSLVSSKLTRKGSATSELRFRYTTNGTGAATRCRVRVWVRVFPLNGESL